MDIEVKEIEIDDVVVAELEVVVKLEKVEVDFVKDDDVVDTSQASHSTGQTSVTFASKTKVPHSEALSKRQFSSS